MVSFVCGPERKIVGWLFSVGEVRLAILNFALRLALLTAEIRCETNSFRSNWFIRLCSDNGFIRSRFRARNCWLTVFIWPCHSLYWASLWDLLYWQLRSVLRQSFWCNWLCDCVPIMVPFVPVFEREIVGWLVSVGEVSLAILSLALRLGFSTAESRCETLVLK